MRLEIKHKENTSKSWPQCGCEDKESSSDVEIIDTPCELPKSSNTSHQIEPYISPCVLPAKVTSTNTQELMFVLYTYIMGIDNAKYLK
jgi:hypothetical protein